MLKITKGLNPYIGAEEGVSIYTDDDGNQYVRVKDGNEDFCVTPHDYTKDGENNFTWKEALDILKTEGLSMFTKKQAELYVEYDVDINKKLNEIGGEWLRNDYYWTTNKNVDGRIWVYNGYLNTMDYVGGGYTSRVRPILNL